MGLVAYTGAGPVPDLLHEAGQFDAADARRPLAAFMETTR
jgi:hypothetical protein